MLVARLLASDFPSENPRTQTRNFPYTSTLVAIVTYTEKRLHNSKQLCIKMTK